MIKTNNTGNVKTAGKLLLVLKIFILSIIQGLLAIFSQVLGLITKNKIDFLGADSFYYVRLLNNIGINNFGIITINIIMFGIITLYLTLIFNKYLKSFCWSILLSAIIVNLPIIYLRFNYLFVDTDILIYLVFVMALYVYLSEYNFFNMSIVIGSFILLSLIWSGWVVLVLLILIALSIYYFKYVPSILGLILIALSGVLFYFMIPKIIGYIIIIPYVSEYTVYFKSTIIFLLIVNVAMYYIAGIKLSGGNSKIIFLGTLNILFLMVSLFFARFVIFPIITGSIILVYFIGDIEYKKILKPILIISYIVVIIVCIPHVLNNKPMFNDCTRDLIRNTDDKPILALWDYGHYINYVKNGNVAISKAHPNKEQISLFLTGVLDDYRVGEVALNKLSRGQPHYFLWFNNDLIKVSTTYRKLYIYDPYNNKNVDWFYTKLDCCYSGKSEIKALEEVCIYEKN